MRTKIFSNLISGLPAMLAIIVLLLFASAGNINEEKSAASVEAQCCTGYKIGMRELKQFMIDSLSSGSFEGGIYSKKDLLKAINNVNGDSVYMMNAWLDCVLNEGYGMFVTSPTTGAVHLISKNPYCSPCPGRACCPQSICAAKLRRECINYKIFSGSIAAENTSNGILK